MNLRCEVAELGLAGRAESGAGQEVLANPVAQWAEEIKPAFSHGRTSAIELAKVVWSAKRKLHFRHWTALWRSATIPFCKRKAELLVGVAKGPGQLTAQ